jgi:hypothetical protein
MEKTISGNVYCKIGKTNDIDKRIRNYQLHNPTITDVLILDEDIEETILFDYRWQRIQNASGRDSEWVCISNNEFICEEFITAYGFQNYWRTFHNGDDAESRLNKYQEQGFIDFVNL